MTKSQNKLLTYQEYKDGMEELQNTDGWKLARKIERLGTSFYIFKANRDELFRSIAYFKNPEAFHLWDVSNKAQMDRFLSEVIRQLHNFVAAAKSLGSVYISG